MYCLNYIKKINSTHGLVEYNIKCYYVLVKYNIEVHFGANNEI